MSARKKFWNPECPTSVRIGSAFLFISALSWSAGQVELLGTGISRENVWLCWYQANAATLYAVIGFKAAQALARMSELAYWAVVGFLGIFASLLFATALATYPTWVVWPTSRVEWFGLVAMGAGSISFTSLVSRPTIRPFWQKLVQRFRSRDVT